MVVYDDFIPEIARGMLIPINFILKNGAEPVVFTVTGLEKTASKLENALMQGLDRSAVRQAQEEAARFAFERGYELSEENTGISLVFTAGSDYLMPEIAFLPEKLDGTEVSEESILNLWDSETVAYGFHRDGKLVSAAVTNPAELIEESPFKNYTEIGVETLPGYRKKGFAFACTAALTDELVRIGRRVMYVCEEKNEPSVMTAKRAGLKFDGYMFFCVCFDGDTEEGED